MKVKTVDRIIAALAIDEKDGIEGLCAHMVGNQWMPLVAADEKRFVIIEQMAEIIAANTGQTIRLVEFSGRQELKTIKGRMKQ